MPLLKTLIVTVIAFCTSPALALNTVTVMADNSLNIAMSQLAADYSRSHNRVVSTSFALSAAQAEQITEGGAADIVITPKMQWIEELKTQGLVDINSQATIARNRLALVAPIDSPIEARMSDGFPTTKLIQQFGWEPSFVVGNPETLQEGVFGKEALRNLGVASDLEEYTLYVKRLDQMFDMVVNQRMYGIFFYSSVIGKAGLRVLDLLPENSHYPITYDAVAIAGDNMEEARKFIEYLKSSSAQAILRDNGFITN